MKKNISLLIALLMTVFAMAQKSTDNFTGRWKTEQGIIIEITKKGTSFIGKPEGKDVLVLKDLAFKNGKWSGTITNPKKKNSANCEAYLKENNIKFIVKKGIISKEIFWTKID